MNYEKFGIITTIVILAGILAISGIVQQVEIDQIKFNDNTGAGAQTKSIEQMKADNIAERLTSEKINAYCQALKIDC